jgi:hypothetical protein
MYTKTDSIKDLLNVWLGRVKIMIQHAPGVPNPNRVTTPTALISVRGTIFDVDVEDIDGTTLVSLDEGSVIVKHKLKSGGPLELLPGQAIRVYPNQPLARASDKGNFIREAARAFGRAVEDMIYTRPGGNTGGGGTIPNSGGKQGDKSTGTGDTSKPGTGTAPAPPTPPPGGGGD